MAPPVCNSRRRLLLTHTAYKVSYQCQVIDPPLPSPCCLCLRRCATPSVGDLGKYFVLLIVDPSSDAPVACAFADVYSRRRRLFCCCFLCLCVGFIYKQAVLRCLYAYFLDIPLRFMPRLPIPLHTVVRLTPSDDEQGGTGRWKELRFALIKQTTLEQLAEVATSKGRKGGRASQLGESLS